MGPIAATADHLVALIMLPMLEESAVDVVVASSPPVMGSRETSATGTVKAHLHQLYLQIRDRYEALSVVRIDLSVAMDLAYAIIHLHGVKVDHRMVDLALRGANSLSVHRRSRDHLQRLNKTINGDQR